MVPSKTVKGLLVFIILHLFVISPLWAAKAGTYQPQQGVAQDNPLTIDFKNGLFSITANKIPLGVILSDIEKQSGLSITINEEIKARKVTVRFSNLDITKTLKAITNAAGLGGYGISYRSAGTPGKVGQWIIDNVTLVEKGDDADLSPGKPESAGKKKSKQNAKEPALKQQVIEKEPYFDKRLNRYVEVVKGEVLVKFAKDVPDVQVKKFHKEKGTKLLKGYEKINAHRLTIPVSESVQGFIEKSLSDKYVYVEPIFLAQQQFVEVNDPFFPDQWAIPKIGADRAWEITNGSPDLIVAVIDTGIDLLHPDLKNKIIAGINIINSSSTGMDNNGHGTFVAGIIAAEANNSVGITGISWQSRLMPVKVLTASGEGTYADLLEGIIYAVDHGARILNLSLGGYSYSQFLADAVQYAHSNKAVIIAAGGNENIDAQIYPAAFPNVIAVSATDASDQRWPSSNHGAYIKLSAPGVGVMSTTKDSSYADATGTSVSTAHATGVAALILSKNPHFSNTQVENILYQTSDDLGDKGWDNYYGAGRVNALKAIEKASIEVHDVAVTNIRIEPETFSAGEATKIIVTVENQGTFAEREIPVKASANDGIIEKEQVISTLKPGEIGTVSFNWLPATNESAIIKGEVILAEDEDISDNINLKKVYLNIDKGTVTIKYAVKTHRWITQKGIEFLSTKVNHNVYLELFSNISEIKDGAEHEDCAIYDFVSPVCLNNNIDVSFRYFRHFYRPVDEKGYFDDISSTQFENSYEWGFNHPQNSYDWQDAITKYKNGQKSEAYFALGHVLHLIEDTSLPEHTHLEAHADVGPVIEQFGYEKYVADRTFSDTSANLDQPQQSDSIIIYDTLREYFHNLAKRSYYRNRFQGNLPSNTVDGSLGSGYIAEMFPSLHYQSGLWTDNAWVIDTERVYTGLGAEEVMWDPPYSLTDDWWETKQSPTPPNTMELDGFYYIEKSDYVRPVKDKGAVVGGTWDPNVINGGSDIYGVNYSGNTLAELMEYDLIPLAIRYVAGAAVYFYDETHPPTITTSISITPQTTPYYIGQTISARFAITNKGATPITVAKLTVGGRDPDGQTADFPFQSCVTLQPNVEYLYEGQLILTKAGSYSFFPAFETTTRLNQCPIPDGNWNTAIPAAAGVTQHTLSNPLNIAVGNSYYTLSVSPVHQPVPQGKSATFSTSVFGTFGYNGTVGLQASITPYEPTLIAAFSQTSVIPPPNGTATSTLTITTTASTPKQSYTVSVQASDGSTSYSQTVTFTVGSVINIGGTTINTNTTWTSGNIYILSGPVTVNSGATLTIEPGVVIKGQGGGAHIIVNGTLNAVGTSGSPIVFTSYKDDAVGGDTNGDGNATIPSAGDWGDIIFNAGSTNSILDHTVVRYGGNYWYNSYGSYCGGWCYGSLSIMSSLVTVQNSTISDAGGGYGIWVKASSPAIIGNIIERNGGYGMLLDGSGASITGNIIRNNSSYGIYMGSGSTPTISGNTISNHGYGIGVSSSTPTITGNTISNNSNGISVSSSTPTITGNTISNNNSYAIYLDFYSSAVNISGNTIAANGNNIVAIIGSGTISSNKTWTTLTPYILTGPVTVNSGATLTIEPGVVIKGQGGGAHIIVNGTLNAVGTSGSPIVFTSYKDDAVGGDTNGDGNATIPSAGDWGDIIFNAGSTNSILDHTVVRYGGNYWYNSYGSYCGGWCYGSLSIMSSLVTVQNSTISDAGGGYGIWVKASSPAIIGNIIERNGGYGMLLDGSGASITGNIIRNNSSYGIYMGSGSTPTISGNTISNHGYGIGVSSSTPTITGNTISNNSNGISVSSSTPTITGNTISNNNSYAIYLDFYSSAVNISGNTIAANGNNIVAIIGSGTISSNKTWTTLTPYILTGPVTVNSGATLTIEPGVVIKGQGGGAHIIVNGTLNAVGTSGSPIVFTSYKDDAVGGDTNGDGNATIPSAGDWGDIIFNAGSTNSILDHTVVRYGGNYWYNSYGSYCGGWCYGSLSIMSSLVTVQNSTISDAGGGYGIWVKASSPAIIGNIIERNGGYGMLLDGSGASITGNIIRNNSSYGIYMGSGSTPTISGNTISNHGYGIYNATPTIIVTAESNYWGAESGPLDSSDDTSTGGLYNPNGAGNRVTDKVDYYPWLSTDPNVKTYYSLTGVVRDEKTQAAIAGVAVNIGPFSTTTAVNGSYSYNNLATGSYSIKAAKTGYFNYLSTISITKSSIRDVNLTPQTYPCEYAQSTLSGYVKSALTKNPIPSATVNLNNGSSATTDPNGHFEIANQASNAYTLTVSASSYVTANQPLNLCGTISQLVLLTKPETSYGTGTDSGYSKDPVNTATGNYTYSRKDMEIPGIGLSFIFERNYNAQDAQDGPLGFGWNHSYNSKLSVNPDTSVTIRWGDGRTETWTPDGLGGFTPQYGVFDILTDNGDGTYTLRKKDETRHNFDSAGRLATIVDKNGNTVTLSYTGSNLTTVADTASRVITFTYDVNNHVTAITDPLPRTLGFTYDAKGDLVSAMDMNGNSTLYTYDLNHQILTVVDPRGNTVVTNVYDDQKRVVVSQKDAKQGPTQYIYDEINRKTTVIDQMSYKTIHYYDDLLRLIQETDDKGDSTFYSYDAAGNRNEIKDKNGNITKYAYDSKGNVTSKTDALNIVTSITYDANDNPLTRTEAVGAALQRTTTFEYDANGNLIKTTNALGDFATISYNAHGQPLTVTDPIGNQTTNTYDAQGNITEVTDAIGNKAVYTYDGLGRRLTATNALGRKTVYTYDNNDNMLELSELDVSSPLHRVTAYTYDKNNNRLSLIDPKGKVTLYTYDVKDLLETITDPLNKTSAYTYDALDRKKSVTDKNGNTTTFNYEAVGNMTEAVDPYGKKTTYTYDANGNRLTETDALLHAASLKYDKLNKVIEATDPLGNKTVTSYDELGRIVSTTNANNQTTLFEYDESDRLTKVTDAAGGVVLYTYDANGNRLTMTDPNYQVTSYEYDSLNRLVRKTEPDGVHEYGYDAVGNMTSKKDPKGNAILYEYDDLNRLVKVIYPDTTFVAYGYDSNNNRISMTDSIGNSTYTYDDLNRMTFYTDPFGMTVGFGYDNNGNRMSLTYPDGKVVNYSYDKLNRLLTASDWLNHVTYYAYDDAGNLSGALNPNSTSVAYAYDNADRLTGFSNRKSDSSVISNYAYTLDAIGNHLSVTQEEPVAPLIPAQDIAYSYQPHNRMTNAGGVVNLYDTNGNMTAKGSATFAYDYNDRLVQSTVGGIITQYNYDGSGNRLAKTENGSVTRYVLDVNRMLTNVLAETDGSGAITAYYVYGLGLISKILPDGTAYYYHYDSRGSTIALTDAGQNVTDAYAYDPFGNVVNRTGTTANPYRYVGRYGVADEGNGLQYIRARYYIPELGRFITKDPLAGKDGDGQSLNRYAYAVNNPVVLIDISGFSPKDAIQTSNHDDSTDELHNYLIGGRTKDDVRKAIMRNSAESQRIADEHLLDIDDITLKVLEAYMNAAEDVASLPLGVPLLKIVTSGSIRNIGILAKIKDSEGLAGKIIEGVANRVADAVDVIDVIKSAPDAIDGVHRILDNSLPHVKNFTDFTWTYNKLPDFYKDTLGFIMVGVVGLPK